MLDKKFNNYINNLCLEFKKYNLIQNNRYDKFNVKRGLRNNDGTGVLAGITKVCNVHGYLINESEKQPIDGDLIYRGINVSDIVEDCINKNKFGFEEVIYLLLFGKLPNENELVIFRSMLSDCRELPDGFTENMIMKSPSNNIMNNLSRSILALYSYDDFPDDLDLELEIKRSINLIAKMPTIMVNAYQAKRRYFDKKSLYLHPAIKGETIAESILSTLRSDRNYTDNQAKLLDLCLILHAEHGGGNNSTFSCRVLTSSGTDAYSAYAAAIGALKGPKHGGANIKVMEMLEHMKSNLTKPYTDEKIKKVLCDIIDKKIGDKSGLIYGMGHAVYTKSDPRAKKIKEGLIKILNEKIEDDFLILDAVERLTQQIFLDKKDNDKTICANVDLYSGLVYKSLGIPQDLFIPLFAVSRMAGWSAHRLEELTTCSKIIRPAYKSIANLKEYVPIERRDIYE